MDEAQRSRASQWPEAFIFIGRFVAVKGIKTLVDAYEEYRGTAASPWSLICCGQGPLESLLIDREGVDVRGFVQPGDLPKVLSEAGCLVLPSTYEPWGVALAEACGSGLPAICSDAVGAADDMIEDGTNGFIFKAGNANALARAMLVVSALGPAIREMGMASRVRAANYESNRWADHLISFLLRLARP